MEEVDTFQNAIDQKKKIEISFYAKKHKGFVTRVCIPMDYGPNRNEKLQIMRYWMYNLRDGSGYHLMGIDPTNVRLIRILDESFDPRDFKQPHPWYYPRDWK